MRNQYFGNRRDLFKYDLLLDVVEAHDTNILTYIPMFRPDDDSGEGLLTQADSRGRRIEVFEFLKNSVKSGKRDIRQLRDLMPKFGITFKPYRDDTWFVQDTRTEYFEAVPIEYLVGSVIFFDPDTGLQTGTQGYMRREGLAKYLLYSELRTVWERASDDSTVVIYQHLQQNANKHASDLERRLADVRRCLHVSTFAVRWHDLAFVAAAKGSEGVRRIRLALQRYADQHDLAFSEDAAMPPVSVG